MSAPWVLLLAGLAADATDWQVAPQTHCRVRSAASADAKTIGYLAPGVASAAGEVSDDRWVSIDYNGKVGWIGPQCDWHVVSADEPSVPPSEETAAEPESLAPSSTPEASPPATRASYGGVFIGRAGTSDPYFGDGGQLSVGGMALLRVEGSPWLAGFSAAYLGGSRFQREVIPYAPGISSGGAGIGNVASIYTDTRHIPVAALSAYGWEFWRVEFVAGGGPSAHRMSVRRREQVSGVSQQQVGDTSRDGEDQTTLTTYTVDRLFDGGSSRWALGATAMGGALLEAGELPFVRGRWLVGVLGMLSTPLGRQHCGDAGAEAKSGLGFGTVCVPLAYRERRNVYYTQGKEDTDQVQLGRGQTLLPIQGFTWSINSSLFFEF